MLVYAPFHHLMCLLARESFTELITVKDLDYKDKTVLKCAMENGVEKRFLGAKRLTKHS
jgi:hypothetical protein